MSEPRNQVSNDKEEKMHFTIMYRMVYVCGPFLIYWEDFVEYAAYISNRSLSTRTMQDLCDIAQSGSTCAVRRDARNKSLGERGTTGVIIVKIDEVKGYRVYIYWGKKVMVAHHVRNVETPTKEQNEQLRSV